MKIKTKKQFRLDELIKYIFDNGIEDRSFPSNGGSAFDMCEARISGSGNIKTTGYINEYTTFTVEVEEELTEETLISGMTGVYYDRQRKELDLTVMQRTAIKYQLGDNVEDILLAIYVGPTLTWSDESGIPESGVLEL